MHLTRTSAEIIDLFRAVRHGWRMHPRAGLAVRTSVAAGLAWLVAQLLPASEAGQYAYFAPMGAVVVTSTSVLGTVRELGHSLAALSLGAVLGLAAMAVTTPTAVSVAVVIAVSVALSGSALLGDMRGWVPMVALFTLVLGRDDPWTYASAYTGLSALGAAIGVAVVALSPQLMVAPLDAAVRRLWLLTIDRLQEIQTEVENGEEIDMTASGELESAIQRVTDRIAEAEDAWRINRRRRQGQFDERLPRARAIRMLAQRLQSFQSSLVDHQVEHRSTGIEPMREPLAYGLGLIVQAMREQHNGRLDARLEQTLTRMDQAVAGVPDRVTGQHVASMSVYELRRLALAARDAVERGTPWE